MSTSRTVPVRFLRAAVRTAELRGIDLAPWLERLDIDPRLLFDDRSRITPGQATRIIQLLCASHRRRAVRPGRRASTQGNLPAPLPGGAERTGSGYGAVPVERLQPGAPRLAGLRRVRGGDHHPGEDRAGSPSAIRRTSSPTSRWGSTCACSVGSVGVDSRSSWSFSPTRRPTTSKTTTGCSADASCSISQ